MPSGYPVLSKQSGYGLAQAVSVLSSASHSWEMVLRDSSSFVSFYQETFLLLFPLLLS